MDRWVGSVAFVTGASAGIGEGICERLVKKGLKVIGFARRQEKLEELAKKFANLKGNFYPYPGDVSKEEDLVNAFLWTKTNVGPVSILINNAGTGRYCNFLEIETKEFEEILAVNTVSALTASREAIKQMEESKIDGFIININSTSGKKILTRVPSSMYTASKYALTALTDSLRTELTNKGSKIRVTGIYPGAVKTELLLKNVDVVARKTPMLKVEDLASVVEFLLSTPPHVQIAELTIKPVGEA